MNKIYHSFDFNKNTTNLRIYESGYANISSEWTWETKNPPFSRVYYMEDGETEIVAGETTLILKKGFVYLLPTGFSLKSRTKKNMKQLFFHINMFDFTNFDLLSVCKICEGVPANDISELVSLYQSSGLIDTLKLKQRINMDCIGFLERSGGVPLNKIYSENVKKSIEYINKNLSSNLKVSDICKSLHVSKGSLNTAFKSEIGKSVGEYIDNTVLEKSKLELIISSASIGEISDKLGFCDQFYFSRKFKEKYGETPSEYRKNNIASHFDNQCF